MRPRGVRVFQSRKMAMDPDIKLDIVPIEEARVKTASGGKRAQKLQEYLGLIDQLKSGQARGWCG